jgi:3-methyladenine DNA glycosylase AlkD
MMMARNANAEQFLRKLKSYQTPQKQKEYERAVKTGDNKANQFMGVRMGQVFALAKEFIDMPLTEIEKLLESPIHEARVGAVSVMDFQARSKKTSEQRRKELFELYIKRHDRINTWDLVDRSAPYVVGRYLSDKPREILYKLARSRKMPERRTAIVSTGYFIRQGDIDDTFEIAQILLDDDEDLIHKATGWMLRAAGDVDRQRLLAFLDEHAAIMPRTALRYAIEHFDEEQREHYLAMKKVK